MSGFVVIIDFSHLVHLSHAAALNAGPDYDTNDVMIENVVGKLRTIQNELGTLSIKGYSLVFAEDRTPKRKLELLPTYRQNRGGLDEEKAIVKKYLLQNGRKSHFTHSPDNEADDLVASLCRAVLEQEQGLKAVVVSGDRDLWQLLQDRVMVFNPIKREVVTDAHVEKAFKCRPI